MKTPSLVSHVKIGSSLAGYLHLTGHDFEIQMDSEYYNIEVIFDVVENHHNIDNGNFYLTTKLVSYNPTQMPLTFHRMGTMEYKGTLRLMAKEILNFIPFCSYMGLCSNHQQVKIKVAENFNNVEYATNKIEFEISDATLHFSKAVLRV